MQHAARQLAKHIAFDNIQLVCGYNSVVTYYKTKIFYNQCYYATGYASVHNVMSSLYCCKL
jgi:hypothetical protein